MTAKPLSPQGLGRLEHEYSLAAEPPTNLMASGQVHVADRIRAKHREGSRILKLIREAEALEACELRRALL